MKKKLYTLIIVIIGYSNLFCQSRVVKYEQIGFDYYKSEILKPESLNNKIKIELFHFEFLTDFDERNVPDCLKNILSWKNIHNIHFEPLPYLDFDNFGIQLDKLDKKQFTYKKWWKKKYPELIIYNSVKVSNDLILTVIKEKNKNINKEYFIIMDLKGNIMDTCKSEFHYSTIIIE